MRAGYTLLHGYVIDDDLGKPIADVTVRLVNAKVETQTDARGHFWLSAPTPPPDPSGWPGSDTVIYEKPGYKTIILENFDIAGEEIGGYALAGLERGSGVIKRAVPPHKLRRGSLASPERPQSARSEARLSPELHRWFGSAGIQAPVIMMSQNRQDKKDRRRGELDFEVNRRAASEIRGLAQKLNLLGDKIDDVEDLLRENCRQTHVDTDPWEPLTLAALPQPASASP